MDNSSLNQTSSPGGTSMDFPWSIPGAILISLLIIFTLLTNIFVCFAISKYHALRTITNYFIINLCVSDTLVALTSMPMWLVFLVYGPELENTILSLEIKYFWNCSDIFFGTAAIVSLAAISLDKLIAITKPFHYLQLVTSKRALVGMVFIWIYSLMVALLKLVKWPGAGYVNFNAPASFFIPLLIIFLSYGKIFLVARGHAASIKTQQRSQEKVAIQTKRGESFRKRSKSKIISVSAELKAAKTILIVILSFLCCWLPFFIAGLCMAHGVRVSFKARVTLKWVTYVNALVNPLVYTFFDRKFRSIVSRRIFNFPCGRDMHASSAYENTSLTYACPVPENSNSPTQTKRLTSENVSHESELDLDSPEMNKLIVGNTSLENEIESVVEEKLTNGDTEDANQETKNHESEDQYHCVDTESNVNVGFLDQRV